MSRYVNFTQEQLDRAAHTDIKSFLEAKGEKVLKSGSEWMWEANHSVKIRGHIFYDHHTGDTGTAINFLCEFYNMRFQDAVYTLLGDDYAGAKLERSYITQPVKKKFILPKRNHTMQRIYAYLMQERGIDEDIITFFVHRRTIYESFGTHNVVFVGLDATGAARSAHEKGTLTQRPFRRDVDGSSKDYFFNYSGRSTVLYVFEAPIDLLAFITINKNTDWQKDNFLALGGLSERALLRFLVEHQDITDIIICLDNDYNAKEKDGSPAPNHGQVMAERYRVEYGKKGYRTRLYTPELKDWDEIAKRKKGVLCIGG